MSARLARFGVVGVLTTAMNYVVFVGLIGLGLHHLLAATVGWALGVAMSFALNKRFTFEVRTPADLREVGSFVGGYVIQLGLGLAVYWILIDALGLAATPAFLVNLVIVSAFSFGFMRLAVFRPAPAGG